MVCNKEDLNFKHNLISTASFSLNFVFFRDSQFYTLLFVSSEFISVFYRCLQADSWRVVSASDDRTLKVTNTL